MATPPKFLPKLSIGLPVYNGEKFLSEALDRFLAQTFKDFEIIICDNASTDRTPQMCREYAERDPRVRYCRDERNLGSVANLNRVFAYRRRPCLSGPHTTISIVRPTRNQAA
jgi:glycosyltransferase involved in cell wall biosynthesis